MRKRFVALLTTAMICVMPFAAYAEDAEKQARISELEQQIAALQAELDALTNDASPSGSSEAANAADGVALDSLDCYSEGQYKAGLDFDPGLYLLVTTDAEWGGSVTVSTDANGDDVKIISLFDYNYFVEVYDSEYIELSRCKAYKMDQNPSFDINKANMFIVGQHIPAGEYKLVSTDEEWGSSYSIYADARESNVKAIDLFDSQAYISVSDGDYLIINRCYIEGIQTP